MVQENMKCDECGYGGNPHRNKKCNYCGKKLITKQDETEKYGKDLPREIEFIFRGCRITGSTYLDSFWVTIPNDIFMEWEHFKILEKYKYRPTYIRVETKDKGISQIRFTRNIPPT